MGTMSVDEARDGFSRLLAEIESTHERVTITRHGQPVAVVLSPQDLASLEETLDVLSTPGAAEAISEGDAELDAGMDVEGAEVLAQLRCSIKPSA
jgi:prevent-host-death family protein